MRKNLELAVSVATFLVLAYVAITLTITMNSNRSGKVAAAPAQPKAVTITGLSREEPHIGPDNAPYTVVLFSDYMCPYCEKAENGLSKEIKKLARQGKVRYVFQDFPLPFHKGADKLAEAGRCAYDVLAWEETQVEMFKTKAMPARFAACAEGSGYKPYVTASMKLGSSIGVTGTPTFIVGKTTPDGVVGKMYTGSFDLAAEIK